MNIGLIDAIKLLKADVTVEELTEMQEKYDTSFPVLLFYANQRAVKIMETAIPMKPETCKEEDKKVHMYCPDCTADISDWQEEWSFCPFCGQAIRIPKEDA